MSKSILLAAMTLTGVAVIPGFVYAEDVPEKAQMSLRYLHYRESQPGLDRVGVNSPAVSLTLPIAGVWSLDASLVSDQVSGASPRYHTAISSASKMADQRHAGDIKIARYFDRVKLSAGLAYSNENDYQSKAASFDASIASDDNNTTWSFGIGANSDRINAVTRNVDDKRRGSDYLLGVTQVLTAQDILQFTLTYNDGSGYFSDPYKSLDVRPRERQQTAFVIRHNHYFPQTDGALRLNYRYYKDSFQIHSHTLGLEYAQPLKDGWTITPSVRLYSQTAADFYFDPVYTYLYIPVGFNPGFTSYITEDQRMSAFGAHTFGLKLSKKIDQDWVIDLKLERYQQRSAWTLFNNTRPALAPLDASILQLGVSRSF
jgi:hypothetical protein